MSVLNIQKFLPKIQNIFKALVPARLHQVAPVSISDEFPNPETGEFNLESPAPGWARLSCIKIKLREGPSPRIQINGRTLIPRAPRQETRVQNR